AQLVQGLLKLHLIPKVRPVMLYIVRLWIAQPGQPTLGQARSKQEQAALDNADKQHFHDKGLELAKVNVLVELEDGKISFNPKVEGNGREAGLIVLDHDLQGLLDGGRG